jgi:hypothetical protein
VPKDYKGSYVSIEPVVPVSPFNIRAEGFKIMLEGTQKKEKET